MNKKIERTGREDRRRLLPIRLLTSVSLPVLALVALPSAAHAQSTIYWDGGAIDGGNPAPDADGGTGTWNTITTNWDSTATGGAPVAWTSGDNAVFGGTAGTITVGTPIVVGNMTFNIPGFTLTGSTLTLQGPAPTITLAGGAGNTTINSVLAGSNGFRLDGGGSTNRTLTLGAANTLTGGITLNSGRLIAAGANALNGAGNIVTVNSGAALQINNSNAFGGNTAAANLVINNGANLWLANQTLTHDITANGGTIVIADIAANGNSTWTGNLVLTADTTLLVNNTGANDNLIFAGNLTDTGANRLSLILDEPCCIDSNLFLTGTNSFSGGITINQGQLYATGADALGGAVGNVVTVNGGGRLVANGNAFGGDTDAAQLILNSGNLRVNANQTLTHDVTLTGGTSFIDGLGNATWNGATVLTASTLLRLGVGGQTLNVRGPLQDTGANVLSVATQGGEVRFNGNLSFSGGLTLASGNTWFDGGTYTYSGDTILNSNARLLLNSASLSPNSNIRFEGLNNGHITIIYGTSAQPNITMANGLGGGQLRWNGTGGFYALAGQSDVIVNLGGAGATLTWNDGLFVPDGHALILGTNTSGGTARQVDFQNGINLSGGLRQVRVDAGNIADHAVLSGVLTGPGGLQVIGEGLLELTNAGNNYSGATVVGDNTTFNVGNLLLGGAGVLSPNSNLQINGAGTGSLVQHGGYVLLNAASGPFTRAVGIGAGQVQWTASGGFGAVGAPQTVNLGGAGAMLAWGSGGFVPTGHALRFGGNWANAAINWQNGIDLGAANRVINVNEGVGAGFQNTSELEVNLNGVIQGAGGLVLNGAGDLALTALNTYTGTTWIGGTSVAGDGDGKWVWANTLANSGVASSLGAGSAVVFGAHGGGLIYTGGVTSTDRTLQMNRTTGAIHSLWNKGSGALTWTGNITTTGSGTNTLRLGGTYTTGDANGDGIADAPNVISGVISDGAGVTHIDGAGGNCAAGGVWRLTGANTFTGEVAPQGCVFEVTTIGNAGAASSVGAGNLIVDFRGNDGTLRYIGSGETSDRSFWAWSNTHLESSGTGALNLTNTGVVVSQNGSFTQYLGGSNTGDNRLAATLVDSPTPVEFTTSWFRLAKDGPGLWALVTDNNAQPNAYAGMTRIFGGALRLDHAGAITGGLGVSSSHGAAGSSQRSSLIRFEGAADGSGGVLGLTGASGGFFRGLTLAGDAFLNNNGTTIGVDPDGVGPLPAYGVEALDDDNYVQGVRWFGSGGFAAWDGIQVVNIGGSATPATLIWNTGGFVPTGHNLVLGYVTANGTVDFQNGINFTTAARTIEVDDGTAAVDGILSGVLTSTTTAGALTKTGTGTLALTNANSYTGVTTVNAGTLQIGNAGSTGTLGGGNVAVAAGASLAFARSDTGYIVANQITGAGTLIQRGTGKTTLTSATNDVGGTVISAGTLQVDGTLTTPTVAMSGTSALTVNGTLGATAGGIAAFTGDAGASTITVASAGTLRGAGDLGGGSDVVNLTGTLNTGAGTLSLGDGDDSFALNDMGVLTGGVLGGAGNDTLQVNNAASRTLAGAQVGGFETLAKTLGGTLLLTGTHDYTNSVSVAAGLLQVDGTVTTQTIALAGGSVFTVNGMAQAAGGTAAMITGNAGVNIVTVTAGGTLRASGDLGDGADFVILAGTLDTGAGTLSLGDGDDNIALTDSAVLTGGVVGGSGVDTLGVNSAADRTLTAAQVSGFETLHKTLAGTLTLTGDHSYANGVAVIAGTLRVGDGTATGTLVGNVANAGTLRFFRAGTSTFAGAISGAGALDHAGTGTTILTGNSSGFTGITTVSNGTLRVNGTLGNATSVVNVLTGGRLGGGGTIGGDVNVADGVLAAGNSPGVLTIAGDLSLTAGSLLDFELGEANFPGGPLNDLIEVGGNLILDGTLNVTQSVGGTFGPGVYRLFNYGGALTDNGLNVASSDYFVQTSVANQVNLVNSAGLTLSFWDGDAGPRNNEVVDGGNGTWRGAGDVNWTDSTGLFAAPYANASFAVFQGAGGAVTVDASGGAVQTAGMQFTADGYNISGAPLQLTGAQASIRVGDGSAGDAGLTATIGSALTGASQLVKTDGGTLVLSGTNTYTGGTAINGGTLQISSNANLGDFTGGLSFSGGTLHAIADVDMIRAIDLAGAGTIDADAAFVTLRGVISGSGTLTKEGNGTLALLADNSYSGGTTIAEGILQIGNGGTAGSILGDVVNNGSLLFARSNSVIFGGAISGSGAVVQSGAGVLTLTADNSYTGITTIRDGFNGALQLGNGGATGSVAGDVANGGTLIFNRSNEYGFAGTISGTGDVRHEGTGTTILTAANSYTGSTIISRGTLLVNGDQTAANGMTNVLGGGTLGGTGTIGGDVFVGGAATLTPGDASGPGTLTINGNLGFSPNAALAYDFGQSNVVGGLLNDLIEVGGNLTLDGTLDVAVTSGGSFDVGVYRVISYAGSLTDNGMLLGTTPAGSIAALQTSVANQVNLVNLAGADVNFWDGGGMGGDGAVSGGDGVWNAAGGNANWTVVDGLVNTAYPDSAFAIFMAAPGTVTVDTDLGAVNASGMQFASSGYTIAGDAIGLTGAESVIRVGDGTAAGAGYTATIESDLTGAGSLVKTDLGTLVLTGTSTIAGDAAVRTGTLHLADGGTLTSASTVVGRDAGEQGVLTVTGSDGGGNASTWSTGDLAVGDNGTGTLNITAGGKVVSGAGLLGSNTGGVGQMLVSGTDSAWENSGRISVGLFGTGTMRIENGAEVSSNDGVIGGSALGEVVVTGANSSWVNAAQLNVGSFGTGMLRIENGASVTSNQGYVGANADGTATVTGAGSNWLVTDFSLTVGNQGNGALTIANGGRVQALGGLSLGVAAGSTGNLTLLGTATDRGILETSQIGAGSGTVNVTLDGGLLRATRNAGNFLTGFGSRGVALGANGGAIDTNGNDIGIAPRFVGAGGLVKDGAGTLTLTGANAYAGATAVNAGTLLVNGNQSAATGSTTVAAAAMLGGIGTIGGDVDMSAGGTLTPGSGGAGTLTVGGNLVLGGGSQLAFEFGQADTVGGALNDLVDVGGNLTLDGTLNVTVPTGGSFGPGIYRVFNYGGTLTDNGLALGTMPGGAMVSVQTAVAGQVNLVNTTGLALSFWDGNAGPKNNGVVNGGNGVWRAAGGLNNWTDMNGTVNADYAQDSFAIFSGLGGTVTIDNGNGNVRAAGMQFAVDGYTLMGGPLELTGADALVRVGDGSAGEAAITAMIVSALTGSARLVKDMGGTLILTGANSYTGGTAINGGTLDVSSDANLGDASGGLSFDGGTLDITTTFASSRAVNLGGTGTFRAQGTGFTLSGAVSGAGALVKEGNGSLTLTADNLYTGGTTINAGVLNLGDGGTTGSILGNIVNNGRFAIDRSNMYTLTGTISGSGELFQMGGGTTIFTAANSYTGATRVSAGTLLINGDQSAATGLTSLAANATLGGTGTIGGDVRLGNGTLAPGAGGAGTLTINGDLSMVAGSRLAYDFGAANTVGSPLNDVVNVGGNLVLDGTLDVAVTPGGAFDIGLYRIANYAGTLTNNGLAIGTMPVGAELAVQTSIVGQVNLVNTGSAVLNFWDGNTGPKFNGAVNGGSGVWWATGTDNWTDMTGAVNASYDNGAFAVFAGRAGAVNIDNSQGAVTASGLQFAASGGYRIQGDALTLTGPQSVVRVGDGTSAGLGYSVIIASEITGNTQLVKTDLGRLELTGVNSYTGGTALNSGTIRISSDANLGAVSGGLSFNGGTLNTTADISTGRTVDLAGQGVLSTNTGTTLTLTGNLTGAGLIGKLGAGTLVLAGTGSHSGGMEVVQGALFVNGDYGAATGRVTMNQLTTLGGTGTIGGTVNLSGALAPGAGGAGTLTVGGDLLISPAATLDFEFGEAGVVGGALNDLVNVGGNLVLDGVLNVSVPTGGAFDIGVYRMFNYGGTLTDNGVALGTMPADSNAVVQTSIAGQINLVNSGALALNFWDGAAGPKNDGVINGGNGSWQASGGNNNWTGENGAVNAGYTDSAFAIFGGTGGTVTVDNSLGAVSAAGMQFAANNYVIGGGDVVLTDATATIRVGDGTTAGAGFIATINSALVGAAQLVKNDAGTLVLGGTNSYSGGTQITSGTLRISSDANLGAARGDVTFDGGTLETSANVTSARDFVVSGGGTIATAADTLFTYNGLFSGAGTLNKNGAGTLLVTGNNSGFSGSTTVAGGTLAVQGSLGGAVTVGAAGRLEGTGRVGAIVNAGIVAPGSSIGSLTVTGDYVGNGGTLEIETVLGGDTSAADRLNVNGATSGSTRVTVINRGGLGAQTVEGIKIVDVAGASNGNFTLDGDYLFDGQQALIAGAYGYRLYKNGVSTPQDGDWYLRSALLNAPNEPQSPLYQPGVPVYEAYVGALQSLNRLPTLQQRVGNRSWAASPVAGAGLWGRFESERQRPEAVASTSDADRKVDQWQAQLGLDAVLTQRSDGATLVGGLTAHYGKADSSVASIFGDGSIDTQGYGVGATMTWYGPQGFYADGQVKLSWFDSDLVSNILGSLARGNKGDGQAFSLELGKQTPIGRDLSITPQVQMSYAKVDFNRFVDPSDAAVSVAKGESLKTRWGLAIDHQTNWKGAAGDTRRTRLYTIMNLSYEWLDGAEADVSGTPIVNRDRRLSGELGLGGSYSWGNDRFTLYTELSGDTAIADFGAGYNLKGTAGFRVRF